MCRTAYKIFILTSKISKPINGFKMNVVHILTILESAFWYGMGLV
jgi:hypothetical protein